MTLKALLTELKRLKAISITDPEHAHILADQALIKYIDDPETTKAFHAIDRWYA